MSIVRESALPGMGVQVSPHPEWFLDTVKILYPAPGGIDGRFLTDPTKPSSNMTNFSYKDWLKPGRSIDLKTIDKYGTVITPTETGRLRYSFDRPVPFPHDRLSIATGQQYRDGASYNTTTTTQYSKTESKMTQSEWDAGGSVGYQGFFKASYSCKKLVETSVTNYYQKTVTTTETINKSLPMYVPGNRLGVMFALCCTQQSELQTGFYDPSGKPHYYYALLPIGPYIGDDSYLFSGPKDNLKIDPPDKAVPQYVVDFLNGNGYKLGMNVVKVPFKVGSAIKPPPIKK
jgi:hypothetical protein